MIPDKKTKIIIISVVVVLFVLSVILVIQKLCINSSAETEVVEDTPVEEIFIRTPTRADCTDDYNIIRKTFVTNGNTDKADQIECGYWQSGTFIEVEPTTGTVQLLRDTQIIATYSIIGRPLPLDSYAYEKEDGEGYMISEGFHKKMGEKPVFFFTTEGTYIEYAGEYIYSI